MTPFLAFCLAIQILFASFYCLLTYQNFFHSDSATGILLANEIVSSGHFFPKDWYYGNHEIWTLNSQLMVLPFVALGIKGYLAQALGGLLNIAIGLFVVFSFCRAFRFKIGPTLLFSLLMINGFSAFGAEHIHGQRTYAVFLWAQLILLASIKRISDLLSEKEDFKTLFRSPAFWGFFSVLFLSHLAGARGLLAISVPLFCALLGIALISPSLRRVSLLISALALGPCLLGLFCFKFILSPQLHLEPGLSFEFVGTEQVARNFLTHLSVFLDFEGFMPEARTQIGSLAGVIALLRVFVATLSLALLFSFLRKLFKKQLWNFNHLVLLFALCGLVLTGYLAIWSAVTVNTQSFRYLLIPTLLLSSAYPLIWNSAETETEDSGKRLPFRVGALLIAVVMVASSHRYLVFPGRYVFSGKNESEQMSLAKELEKRKLDFGYATYWNAGAVSILSKSKVFVSAINLEKKNPVPYYWLSSKRWYAKDFHPGKTFLLFRIDELNSIDKNAWIQKMGAPSEIDRTGAFEIWTYLQNPTPALKWD